MKKGKKLIGAKMRRIIETDRATIRDYRKRSAKNLRRNIQIMKHLQIRPKDNQVMANRVNAIKQASKKR